ncbi:MAG: ATP-binding cassette domain-containing protein [Pseudomonadota bacterium]
MIEFKDVHKSFGDKRVLHGLDLTVQTGKSLVVIGGSGSGKSVLLKCLLGIVLPERGQIIVDGQDFLTLNKDDHTKAISKIGMLFQAGALFDSLPVWHNVCFGLLARGTVNRRQAREIAIERLTEVNLAADVVDLYPASLSGGMQKRVALARAIAFRPSIILFDEPTTGLDPITAAKINNLIVKCVRELGATAISITHDMASVRRIADTVAMLYQGQIIWTGTPDQLDDCENPYVAQFVHGRAEGPIGTAR